MEFSSLRIFLAVAREGSVSKAARRLNYVQPNVTARIRKLEEELEVKLFHRKPRGMSLTQAGRVLLDYAQRAERLMDQAQKAVQDQGEVKGKLSLGSLSSTAAVRLPAVLTRYHEDFPAVELSIATGRADDLIAQVLDYKLDGAFVTGPVEHHDLEQQTAFWENLVLVAKKGQPPPPGQAYRNILVYPRGRCHFRARLEYWLREKGLVPFQAMELETLEGIMGCVAAGMGVSLLPESVVSASAYAGQLSLHPLPAELTRIQIALVWRRDSLQTKAMKALREILDDPA